MGLTDTNRTIADLEQHSIAADVMRKVTAQAITQAGALDRKKAASFLRAAATERRQHGDHRAAQLLDEWAEKMARAVGDGEPNG